MTDKIIATLLKAILISVTVIIGIFGTSKIIEGHGKSNARYQENIIASRKQRADDEKLVYTFCMNHIEINSSNLEMNNTHIKTCVDDSEFRKSPTGWRRENLAKLGGFESYKTILENRAVAFEALFEICRDEFDNEDIILWCETKSLKDANVFSR